MRACKDNHLSTVKVLLSKCDVGIRNKVGQKLFRSKI